MKFTTTVSISPSTNPINYQSETFFMGSCFSEHIAQKFTYHKLRNTSNPFGILFHPLAIYKIIKRALENVLFVKEELLYHNELWLSLDVHSELSTSDSEQTLNLLNNALVQTRLALQQATHIIITLGTAWVYRHIEQNNIVANCHKIPQKQFSKELLSIDKIQECLLDIMRILPNKHFIFTISPVRHLKDGFFENNLSKGHLFAALHQVLKQGGTYFPSYEIVTDELRDYRFYADDMIHPNTQSVNYVWERFYENHLSKEAQKTAQEIAAIQKALTHKPFNPNTQQHQEFVQVTQKRIEALGDLWF